MNAVFTQKVDPDEIFALEQRNSRKFDGGRAASGFIARQQQPVGMGAATGQNAPVWAIDRHGDNRRRQRRVRGKTGADAERLSRAPHFQRSAHSVVDPGLDGQNARMALRRGMRPRRRVGLHRVAVQKTLVSRNHRRRIAHLLYRSLFKPNRARTQRLDLVHRMRAKKNCRPLVAQGHDAVERLARKRAVADRQGFIDDQNVRVDAGGDGKSQPNVHSAGIGLDRLVDEVADAREINDGVVAFVDLGFA